MQIKSFIFAVRKIPKQEMDKMQVIQNKIYEIRGQRVIIDRDNCIKRRQAI